MRPPPASRKSKERLARVRTEEQEIKTRTQQFQQMEQAGITGQEKRLDWTELLRDLQQQLRLPGMSYEFGPQVPLETTTDAGYAYHSSQLKIQLRLLHEEDLLNFITRLQQEAKAMVLVRSCKLVRLPAANSAGGSRPAERRVHHGMGHAAPRQRSEKAMKRQLPALLLLLAALPAWPQSEPLGRLFTTPQQRSALDRERLLGQSQRPSGSTAKRATPSTAKSAAAAARTRAGSTANRNPRQLRSPGVPAGDTFHPATGERESLLGDGRIVVKRPPATP